MADSITDMAVVGDHEEATSSPPTNDERSIETTRLCAETRLHLHQLVRFNDNEFVVVDLDDDRIRLAQISGYDSIAGLEFGPTIRVTCTDIDADCVPQTTTSGVPQWAY